MCWGNVIGRDKPLTRGERCAIGLLLLWPVIFVLAVSALCCGCFYKGGKIIDGTNLAIGITIPGTEFTINALDYVGGVRVAGNDQTSIIVTNEVAETNRYFGVVETSRHSKMTAKIEPTESEKAGDGK